MKTKSFLERAMKAERELETEKNNRNHLIEKGAGLERKLTALTALTAERDQLRAEVERLRSDLVALEECHDDNCRAVVKIAAELTAVTAERDQLRLDCDNESKWAAHYLELFIANRDRADKAEEQFRILKKTFDHVTNMYDAAVTRAERAEHKLRVRCVSFVTPKKSRNK